MKKLLLLIAVLLLQACIPPVMINPADPLEKRGPYGIKYLYVSFDTATSTQNIYGRFYYPGGTFANGSRPLVVMTHGFGAHYGDYAGYAEHLASHGYVVLGMDFVDTGADATIARHDDKAVQLSEGVTYATTASPVKALINSGKIAAMGHSMGGKIAFYAAALDNRIRSVVALDPSNAGGPPCFISPETCANYPVAPNPARGAVGIVKDIQASSLILRSRPDGTNPEAEFNASYFFLGYDGLGQFGAPSVAYYIDLGSAPHASYLPVFNAITYALAKRSSLAWLQQQFEGKDNSAYFSGSILQKDIAAGRVVSFSAR